MKYAANITRKPGGLSMASACGKCDGGEAVTKLQQLELASIAIHDDPKNRSRAVRNVRIAEHGGVSLEGQLLKAQNNHEDEAELRERFESFAQPAKGTGKHRAEDY
jgi:hypothetical protein